MSLATPDPTLAKGKEQLGKKVNPNRQLLIAIAFGVVAALLNLVYIANLQGTEVTAYRAKQSIHAGARVTEDMFEKIRFHADEENVSQLRSLVVEEKYFAVFKEMALAETLGPGQVLFQSSFRFDGMRGIRDTIRQGERAIALRVADDASAVGYFVRPGDTVDVYAKDASGAYQNVIPKVTVRAVGDAVVVATDSGGRGFRYPTVTVVVPEDRISGVLGRLEVAKGNVTLALAGRGEN